MMLILHRCQLNSSRAFGLNPTTFGVCLVQPISLGLPNQVLSMQKVSNEMKNVSSQDYSFVKMRRLPTHSPGHSAIEDSLAGDDWEVGP